LWDIRLLLNARLGATSILEGSNAMNNQTDHLDHADEEILTFTVSDEALEAAAGAEAGVALSGFTCHFASWVQAQRGCCG
jgi:hypothetical protein